MKEKIINILSEKLKKMGINNIDIVIEIPKNKENGDYSTNIAMRLAKELHKSPMEIANDIIKDINSEYITKISVASPGFINFYVTKDYLLNNIFTVLNLDKKYGSSNIGNHQKINIEFVSANPTGILHIGNARGGAYGDSLARIMSFCGYDVTKEYYLNDNGNQINKLTRSIFSRYLTLCGIDNEFPEDGYPGQEIKDIAQEIFSEYGNKLSEEDNKIFRAKGIKFLTDKIFNDLKEYRVEYDVITSEKDIYDKYPISDVLSTLDSKGYLYEKEDAKWFKSSSLLDEEDHVLVKADGNYTYLLPDISYHIDKLNRGYEKMIDVLGTDHHGYIARLKSGIKAMDGDADKLEVKLLQLVRIVKDKQAVVMHKRSGNIVTLRDLINEVGVNAARYYFSKYSLDTQMDFDIELAKKKSNDNPIYYVCYAYARICSILQKYPNLKPIDKIITINSEEAYNVLTSVYRFPEVVQSACQKEMPHIITNYVYDLASAFHLYYEKCRVVTEDEQSTLENLYLIKCVQITLYNALNLIGVIPEERM